MVCVWEIMEYLMLADYYVRYNSLVQINLG